MAMELTNVITIGSGKTLTLAGAMTVGDASAPTTKLTMIGGGSMNVNAPAMTFTLGPAGSGTLDVSALSSFTASVTNFRLGDAGSGTLVLSDTANAITTTVMRLSAPSVSGYPGVVVVTLGAGSNVIRANDIRIADSRQGNGTMKFLSQASGSSGTVTITDKAGTGAANIYIADQAAFVSASSSIRGLLDLRGHSATVMANALRIGIGLNNKPNAGSGQTGTLSFDTGTFTVNSVLLGHQNNAGTATALGNINIGGGVFTVNAGSSFVMALNSAGIGGATGNLNVTGGVFTCNANITKGGGVSTTANLALTGGTIDMKGYSIGIADNTINMTLSAGTLKNVAQINGGTAALTKGTSGTLTLDGVNTFTNLLTVSAGTLALDANSASTVGTVAVTGSGTLALGDGTGSLSFADSSTIPWTGTLTLTGTLGGSTLRFGTNASALTADQLSRITINGKSVALNATGYVVMPGMLILFL